VDSKQAAEEALRAGHALEDAEDLEGALRKYQAAAALTPASPRPLLNIGNILHRQRRLDDAIETVNRAIELDPSFAPSHYNAGLLHMARGAHETAEVEFRKTLQLTPQFSDAILALAHLLETTNRLAEAESVLRPLASTTHPRALYSLALLLIDRDECDEAESLLHRAIAVDGRFAPAHAALGDLCLRTGRAKDADAWFLDALAIDPSDFGPHSARLFALNARSDLSSSEIFAAHRLVGELLRKPEAASNAEASNAARSSAETRRLRIGYLSGDLRQHAVALFLRPVLANHDREHFEIFVYDTQTHEDPITAQLRNLNDAWRNIAELDDSRAAALIRSDQLDVLIDLSGHTTGSRIALLAARCAPVQMTWLGYLNTTGLSSVGYRICDAHTDPPGMTEHLYTEQLLRLPHSQWCYTPAFEAEARRRFAHIPGPLFGAFNQFWKVSEPCIDLWRRLLEALPSARLLAVGVPRGRTAERFVDAFAASGIAAERLILKPRVSIKEYATLLSQVDIALDTFPYNGATTTLDALWSGTPLVAIAGERALARGSYSILTSLQMPELVAANAEAWLEINIRLATDSSWLQRLHTTLRVRVEASPLMMAAAFTQDLESLITQACARSVA
jgi:protein O-GlcNAc transferase